MDTIIEMEPEMAAPGIGMFSLPMSLHSAGAIMKALKTVDLSTMDPLDALAVSVFTSLITIHVRENAIERLAHLGVQDIEEHLKKE